MGLNEKIANAKDTQWVAEGMSQVEAKTTVELAKISARIEKSRLDMGMTQQEFADYMGVSQGMVSKWESRDYNFTVRTLNEICEKLKLNVTVEIDANITKNYIEIKWDKDRMKNSSQIKKWIKNYDYKEEIA